MWAARQIVLHRWAQHAPRDAARKALQTPPQQVQAARELDYLGDGAPQHRLDAFWPSGAQAKALPVILDVHGGGWAYGNKELNEYYCMALAQLGFLVLDINYTLAPQAALRRQVQEVAAAIGWAFAHAAEWGGDMRRFCLTGDSAGAQLALLTCAAASNAAYRRAYDIPPLPGPVRALGLTCPVTCLHAMARQPGLLAREQVRLIYGGAPQRSPLWRCSDPEDFLPQCAVPPVFLLTTPGDQNYHWQAVALHQLLQKAGKTVVYHEQAPTGAEPLGHVFSVLHHDYAASRSVNAAMAAFFRENFSCVE